MFHFSSKPTSGQRRHLLRQTLETVRFSVPTNRLNRSYTSQRTVSFYSSCPRYLPIRLSNALSMVAAAGELISQRQTAP